MSETHSFPRRRSAVTPPLSTALFPATYVEARKRFITAARAAGGSLHSLPIAARGPNDEMLSIDIAVLGDERPSQAVVHCSGLHGVEGFAGSAIQLALLAQAPEIAAGRALVLVHALNPYGMAWLRRVNERNVDLNRNFGVECAHLPATSDGYRRVERLLNPPTPPEKDAFRLKAAAVVLRHGLGPMTAAVARGQYEYPLGLFYGGSTAEEGVSAYTAWLRATLSGVSRGLAIDVHTGLGARARESLFLKPGSAPLSEVAGALARRVSFDGGDRDVGYGVHGGHGSAFSRLTGSFDARERFGFVTQEFGTYPSLRVLHALREENRWHHYGDRALAHETKRDLLEMFAPAAPAWRDRVVAAGVSLARRACEVWVR
jgi:hypothetical protein